MAYNNINLKTEFLSLLSILFRSCRIRIAGDEKDYDPKFKLFLQTKLANPHYKPEIFAQCSLVNFIVTENGLEEK